MLMAGAALIQDFQPEFLGVVLADGVGGVAINTDGQLFLGMIDRWAVDGAGKFIGDTEMTIAAGVNDVVPVDAGFGIAGRQDRVGRVAAGAGGRYDQARFFKPLAMDAHIVMIGYSLLVILVAQGRFFPFLMATGAQFRDVAGKTG